MKKFKVFDYIIASDGCTFLPIKELLPACLVHDLEYSFGGSQTDRKAADMRLWQNAYTLGYPIVGSVMNTVCHWLGNMGYWGDNTILTYPECNPYPKPWLDLEFNIKSNFWSEI